MHGNKVATIRMEEKYIRFVIEYENDNTRDEIDSAIREVEKETSLYPSVIRRAYSEHSGNFSVEFEVESEIEHRDAGEFCEKVMKKLNITECEN